MMPSAKCRKNAAITTRIAVAIATGATTYLKTGSWATLTDRDHTWP